MRIPALSLVLFLYPVLASAAEDIEKTIKDLYTASHRAMREAKSQADIERLLSEFAPEWVGNMPAGETLTFADLKREAESALAIPPERRPVPKLDFVYMKQTGWNVLVVCWNYRQSGRQTVGSLYRDTWVLTANGWRQTRQEKFFPDRTLIEDGKPVFLPGPTAR